MITNLVVLGESVEILGASIERASGHGSYKVVFEIMVDDNKEVLSFKTNDSEFWDSDDHGDNTIIEHFGYSIEQSIEKYVENMEY